RATARLPAPSKLSRCQIFRASGGFTFGQERPPRPVCRISLLVSDRLMQSRHLRQVAARFQQRVFVRSLSGAQLFAVLETTTMLKSVTSRAVAAKTGIFKRFARNQDASAAIEFGFVALPFLALLFAILETALVFFANQTLEAAVANAGR